MATKHPTFHLRFSSTCLASCYFKLKSDSLVESVCNRSAPKGAIEPKGDYETNSSWACLIVLVEIYLLATSSHFISLGLLPCHQDGLVGVPLRILNFNTYVFIEFQSSVYAEEFE